MIDVLFFSIAGKKTNDEIEDLLHDLQNQSYISKNDKLTIKYTLEVSQNGHYPDESYYSQYYQKTTTYRALAEIKNHVRKLKDFYSKEDLIGKVYEVINTSTTKKDFTDGIANLIEDSPSDADDTSDFRIKTYKDRVQLPSDVGILTGISEVDQATNGFQPGCLAFIPAFTSHGKSVMANSITYKAIKSGKKGVLFSLEIHPDLVSMAFEARYLYQECQIEINAQELINNTLTDEKSKIVLDHDSDFADFMKNLIITDESVFNKQNVLNAKLMQRLFKKFESILGGLDFVVFDHVGQFDLLFQDMGNAIIKTIQTACKTYSNQNGLPLTGICCVQTNRQGMLRASKRDGRYDLVAISDLNECMTGDTELFINNKCMTVKEAYDLFRNGETLTARVYDYDKGCVVDSLITDFYVSKNIEKGGEWRRLYWGNEVIGTFTPNHRFLIDGNKVYLNTLPRVFEVDQIVEGHLKKLKVFQVVGGYNHDELSYNLTVAHHNHSYMLPTGVITSNCERSATYVMFLYTDEDMRINQETKITLAKNRLGTLLPEPIVTSFVPQVMTVGDLVEKVEYNDDFGNLTSDFGNMSFDDFGTL